MEHRYKDWATTVRDVKTRPNPINLPSSLKNYFEKALKKDVVADTYFRGPQSPAQAPRGSTHGRGKNYIAGQREALSYVTRNNPHPFKMVFPFQTGDRLQSYMIWLPRERGPVLPPLPLGKPQFQAPPTRSESRVESAHAQFEGPHQSTYQAEISRMPLLRRRVMTDHFPVTSKHQTFSSHLKVH